MSEIRFFKQIYKYIYIYLFRHSYAGSLIDVKSRFAVYAREIDFSNKNIYLLDIDMYAPLLV